MRKITESIFRVIDTETTDIDVAKARIVEIGVCDVFGAEKGRAWHMARSRSVLCDPGCPIPPQAKAVHHILDLDVRGKPTAETAIEDFITGETLVFCAHNAAYDRPILEAHGFPRGARWLCTYRLAMHVWPAAPSYKNEVLRYWLGYDRLPWQEPGKPIENAHRAGYDARVTALVLSELLKMLEPRIALNDDIDKLCAMAASPVFLADRVMGFGKHHDKTWREVAALDSGYLNWMLRQPESDWEIDQWYTAKKLMGRDR